MRSLSLGAQPVVAVRFCPVLYRLRQPHDTDNPAVKLPYRMVFALATLDSIVVYDTQVGILKREKKPRTSWAHLHTWPWVQPFQTLKNECWLFPCLQCSSRRSWNQLLRQHVYVCMFACVAGPSIECQLPACVRGLEFPAFTGA